MFTILLPLLVLCILIIIIGSGIYPFLMLHTPKGEGVLVIEGWIGDYALEKAARYLSTTSYEHIIVTGWPIENGRYLSEYKTTAEVGIQTLVSLGIPEKSLLGIPYPYVNKNRTYTSALIVKAWMEKHAIDEKHVDVFTFGAHSRRTRDLFQLGFGNQYRIGTYCCPPWGYNSMNWWKLSHGARSILVEGVAWLHIKLFFKPFPIEEVKHYQEWLP